MNVLGLVFSILLILSYGYYSFFDKSTFSHRLRSTYLSNQKASRAIFNEYESKVYNSTCKRAPYKPDETRTQKKEEKKEEQDDETEEEDVSGFNQECARINLWPLLQEGREAHPTLYELTAKLIRSFYEPIALKEKRFEYQFLDRLLSSAKLALQKEGTLAFEKVDLGDSDWQKIYYKMLKGTKRWDLKEGTGYPPLLDYIKATPLNGNIEKICLFHANSDLLTALFNAKIAHNLHHEAHKPKGSPLTEQLLERISLESGQIQLDPELIKLLQFGHHFPKNAKTPFVSEKGGVILRKDLSVEG